MKIHETPKREKLRVLVIWGVKRRLKDAIPVWGQPYRQS